MALLDKDGRKERGWFDRALAGFDRRLLVVALALTLLTLLAVLDLHRPVPGSERPVEVRIPAVELPLAVAPAMVRRIDPDALLAYD